MSSLPAQIKEIAVAATLLRTRMTAQHDALVPFARFYRSIPALQFCRDDHTVLAVEGVIITVGDLKRAHELCKPTKETK